MTLRFTVLASGSGGNASLLEVDGFGLLLDAGLGPRELEARLKAVGASWASVQGLLLTHTHSDHWNENTLTQLYRRRIPLYCHPDHHRTLRNSTSFASMQDVHLVRDYSADYFNLAPALRCWPLPVRHDSGAAFGFRFEGPPDLFGQCCALGYASDLGCWDADLAEALANVDLLAIEFNHDVAMQQSSGRPASLILRVLGDEGHLSNAQGAALLRAVLKQSTPGRLQHVVLLHLSRDCNRPMLAEGAAQAVLTELRCDSKIHTANQHRPCKPIQLTARRGNRSRKATGKRTRTPPAPHPWLPGFDSA